MLKSARFESRKTKRKLYKPNHEEPKEFFLDYILLPYGMYYKKTLDFLEAKTGDILRFFNGPEYQIESVTLIKCDRVCDLLCRMRYGIPWEKAYRIWQRYAIMEGNGKDILSKEECFFVVYNKNEQDTLQV